MADLNAIDEAITGDPDDYVLEDQVGHLLRRAHQRATAIFLDRIGDSGVTPPQFAALVKLRDMGEVSQNHLGRLTAMDPATSQGVIRRLSAKGLIGRAPDQGDRRRALWRLTDGGARLIDKLVGEAQAVSDRTLAPLGGAERRAFLDMLRRLA